MFQRSSQLRKQSRGERENRCLTQPVRWCHPIIAQLVEHLTVALCSDQMVPGSIPGDRMLYTIPGEGMQKKELQKASKWPTCSWPLRKDDTHKSRSVSHFFRTDAFWFILSFASPGYA